MLTPEEATPRALAMLTLAHELYSGQAQGDHTEMDEDEVHAVLADDDGVVDWQSIAIALSMIGHILLDTIPTTLYAASEEALTKILAQHFNTAPDSVRVTINNQLTGTDLLRTVSLRVLEMSTRDLD